MVILWLHQHFLWRCKLRLRYKLLLRFHGEKLQRRWWFIWYLCCWLYYLWLCLRYLGVLTFHKVWIIHPFLEKIISSTVFVIMSDWLTKCTVQILYLSNHFLHVITFLMLMPIDLTDVTRWCTSTTQRIGGSWQQIILKRRAGILRMSACMATGAPKIIMIFLNLFDVL